MKNYAVVFTHNNARLIYAEDLQTLKGYENVVLNPDLGYVRGIAPHFWKFVNGFIMPMDEKEQEERMASIIKSGTQNDVHARQLQALEEKRQATDKAIAQAEAEHQKKLDEEYQNNVEQYEKFKMTTTGKIIHLSDQTNRLDGMIVKEMETRQNLGRDVKLAIMDIHEAEKKKDLVFKIITIVLSIQSLALILLSIWKKH